MDKVIDIEERIPSLRERRKKRTNRKFFALLMLLLILLAILIYSQTQWSQVRQINISGADLYEEERYLQESGLVQGDSMWSFNEEEIAENLQSLDWVEEATVKKNWLTTVDIEIDEFNKIGYLESGTSYQMVLENGHLLDKSITSIDGPLFTNFEDREVRGKLVAQLQETAPEVFNLISQIILNPDASSANSVVIYMNDGNEVRAFISSLAEKLNYYPSVLAQLDDGQKGVIDMEVGIYFRSYIDVYGIKKEGLEVEETNEE
ncbi:MAG TPA: FtsQ-type POTRA domain-containing protein [Planococcus sp. (in: firmicutes)]|nr:FtsQ-type POTRA domain-containing protein [Planococcus sp. (in: firmicutes)]